MGRLLYGGHGQAGPPCRAGQAWRWSATISFQLLSPAAGEALSSNNSSCVLQIQVGELTLLLPGDIDRQREKTMVRYWRQGLESDWLLAAHHGSISSTSLLWLKYVQPAEVVFSSGYGNAFGHPHPTVVRRVAGGGRGSYTTSTSGALEVYLGAGDAIRVRQYRLEEKRYWF